MKFSVIKIYVTLRKPKTWFIGHFIVKPYNKSLNKQMLNHILLIC